MRRGDLSYWDGARARSFDTTDVKHAALLVAQLPTPTLRGITAAGVQLGLVNTREVVTAAALELDRRERSERAFERALAAGTSSRLRRQSWGFVA